MSFDLYTRNRLDELPVCLWPPSGLSASHRRSWRSLSSRWTRVRHKGHRYQLLSKRQTVIWEESLYLDRQYLPHTLPSLKEPMLLHVPREESLTSETDGPQIYHTAASHKPTYCESTKYTHRIWITCATCSYTSGDNLFITFWVSSQMIGAEWQDLASDVGRYNFRRVLKSSKSTTRKLYKLRSKMCSSYLEIHWKQQYR